MSELRVTENDLTLATLVACGLTFDQIAAATNRTKGGVRRSTAILYEKLFINRREELVLWAIKSGLVTVDEAWEIGLRAKGMAVEDIRLVKHNRPQWAEKVIAEIRGMVDHSEITAEEGEPNWRGVSR